MRERVEVPEFEESPEDIYQRTDVPFEAIPVHVTRAVRNKELPATTTGVQTFALDAITPIRVLMQDPKRHRATLIGYDQNLLLGTTQAQAKNLLASGIWPNLLPLVWGSAQELWVMAAASTATVTVITDYWTD